MHSTWRDSYIVKLLTTTKVMDSHFLLVSDFFPLTVSPSIPGEPEAQTMTITNIIPQLSAALEEGN